jgi:tyrosinase
MAGPTWENPIKSFFRQFDIDSMKDNGIDLGSYQDVKKHAKPIYERTAAGDMPCDEPWPADRVATFQQWKDAGCPEK